MAKQSANQESPAPGQWSGEAINLVQRREQSRGKGNSRSSCVTDRKIDVRPQTGTAPDEPTDMREPANKSLLTDVSGFCFHPCTIIPTHTSPQFLEKNPSSCLYS